MMIADSPRYNSDDKDEVKEEPDDIEEMKRILNL